MGINKMSTSQSWWSWDDTERSCKLSWSRWWQTKWQLILIFLIHSWKRHYIIMVRLSQSTRVTKKSETLISYHSYRNHRSSLVVSIQTTNQLSVKTNIMKGLTILSIETSIGLYQNVKDFADNETNTRDKILSIYILGLFR